MKSTLKNILNWLLYPEKPYSPESIENETELIPVYCRNTRMSGLPFVLPMAFILLCSSFSAQVLVGENTVVAGSGNGSISMDSSLTNNGSLQFSDSFSLHLNGEGVIEGEESIVLPRLYVHGLEYELMSDMTITDSLYLVSGTIETMDGQVFLIEDTAGISREGESHVKGFLSHQGQGGKFYPVGADDYYAPVTLVHEGGDNALIVELAAYQESFALGELPASIEEASPNWYWAMNANDEYEGSNVTLPILSEDAEWLQDNQYPVVIESDELGQEVMNLGGSYEEGDGNVTSTQTSSGKIIMLGSVNEVDPIIHNIITPGSDADNPYLVIENIEALGSNEVSLIDRWGNEVFNQKNFKNYNDSDNPYDGSFDDFPSGNYVCLLRLGNETTSQMVTIIKK